MKRILLVLFLAVSFGMVSLAQADILDYGDAYYVGFYTPNTPSGEPNEQEYIDWLVDVAQGEIDTQAANNKVYTFNRENGIAESGTGFPTASFADKVGAPFEYMATGEKYILGKYGGGSQVGVSLVWYSAAGFNGKVTLAQSSYGLDPDGKSLGLSHISGFNGGSTTSVPEPMAMGLVGAGVLLVGFVRRRVRK